LLFVYFKLCKHGRNGFPKAILENSGQNKVYVYITWEL